MTKQTNRWLLTVFAIVLPSILHVYSPVPLLGQVHVDTDERGMTIDVKTAPARLIVENSRSYLRLHEQAHVMPATMKEFLAEDPFKFSTQEQNGQIGRIFDSGAQQNITTLDGVGPLQTELHDNIGVDLSNFPAYAGHDEFTFTIAVPDASTPQISTEILSADFVSAEFSESGLCDVDLPQAFGAFDQQAVYTYLGSHRGVHIAAVRYQPYQQDDNFCLKTATRTRIRLNFNQPVPTSPNPEAPRLMVSVLNQAHVPFLGERRRQSKSAADKVLGGGDAWFSVEQPTVKLTTERDGIARITLGELGAAGRILLGRDPAFLRLFYDGVEQPIQFVDDGSGQTSDADILYFLGRRSTGDTTYFDVHSNHAVFFLTWAQEGEAPQRFEAFPQVDQVAGDVVDVTINRHIEEDHFYNLGDVIVGLPHTINLHRSEPVTGEGWLWRDLRRGEVFEQRMPTAPSERPGSTLDFVFRYKTISDDQLYAPDHFLQFFVNKEMRGSELFDGYRDRELVARIGTDSVLAGTNLMEVTSLGAPEWRESVGYVDVSAMNYVAMRGSVKPFAWAGSAEFTVAASANAERLVIPGFSQRDVFVIDAKNNLFGALKAGRAGVTVRAGARAGTNSARSVYINDQEIFYDNIQGEAAVIADNNSARIISVSDVRGAYAEAANGTAIVLLFNDESDVSSDFTSAAEALNLNANGVRGGTSWMGAAIKGGESISRGGGDALVASISTFLVHSTGQSHELAVNLEAGREHAIIAGDASVVERPEVWSVGTKDLSATYRADLIIIAHADFRTEAERLAQYRRDHSGLAVEVVDVDDIYTQYNQGRKHPQAIKSFLDFAYNNWAAPAPEALILFGDASWDMRGVSADAIKKDYVPAYGRPVSDYWYGLLDGTDLLADIIIGRISVETPEEARVVVDKIISYEAQPKRPWQKNFLFLAGGSSAFEIRGFRSDAISISADNVLSTPLCGTIDTVFKANASNVSTSQGRVIREKINRGAVWVNYVGHAAPTIFDMDFGDARELNNGDRYPMLATFSCQTAAFAEPSVVAKNEEFVRESGRGMVAALGTTGFGNIAVDNLLLRGMLAGIRFKNQRRMGEILFEGKWSIMTGIERGTQNPFDSVEPVVYNTVMQYSLIGDPYLELPIDTLPNLYVLQEDVTVVNADGNRAISEKDNKAFVTAIVRNAGIYISDSVVVRLEHVFEQESHIFLDTVPRECFPREFKWELDVATRPGQHKIVLDLDPFENLDDVDRENNRFEMSFSVFPEGVFALDPLPHWNVALDNPVFRVMTPRDFENFNYEFGISTSILEQDIFLRSDVSEATGEYYTEWRPNVELTQDQSYWMFARSILKDGERPGDWLIIPFVTRRVQETQLAEASLRSLGDFAGLPTSFEILPEGDSVMLAARNILVPLSVRASGSFSTRIMRVQVGDSLYIDDALVRGVHVYIFGPGQQDARYYKRFDTYDADSTLIEELLGVLENEAGPNETVLLANCDESWRRIESLEFVEQYRAAVRGLGAEYADSLGESSTYFLYSRNGRALYEEWRDGGLDNTPIQYDGDIETFADSYTLSTQTFGPSQEWRSFALESSGDPDGQWTVEVWGTANRNSAYESLKIVEARNVDLSDIDVERYPWLRFDLRAVRGNVDRDLLLTNVAVTFVPEAELGILESETNLLSESVQRGEPDHLDVTVENLSPRAPAKPYSIIGLLGPSSGQSGGSYRLEFNNPELPPMQTWSGRQEILTADLAELSELRLTVAPERLERELYVFNNGAQFDLAVQNDVVDPTLRVFLDGEVFVDGKFIHNRPRVRVELFDDSPLPVLDVNNLEIELRRRGPLDAETSMADYSIELVNDGSGLKVVAEFDAELLIGDNPLTIEGWDATGNSTSATFNLVVSSRAEIGNPIVSPNPISDNVTVQFSLVDNFLPTNGWIEVFDLMGGRVASVSFAPEVGQNTVQWNMRAGRNQLVAQGTYYLRVYVLGGSAILYSDAVPIMFIR